MGNCASCGKKKSNRSYALEAQDPQKLIHSSSPVASNSALNLNTKVQQDVVTATSDLALTPSRDDLLKNSSKRLHKSVRSVKRGAKAMHEIVATLELNLEYSAEKKLLMVDLVEIRDIDHHLFESYNTFYLKTYILPDPEKKSKKKTKMQQRHEPIRFEEQITYEIAPSEISKNQIEISLWTHGVTNTSFGEVILNLWEFEGNFQVHENFPMMKRESGTSETASLKRSSSFVSIDDKSSVAESVISGYNVEDDYGCIELNLLYDPLRQVLYVTVFEAKDLLPTDGPYSNPFAKLSLIPREKKEKSLISKIKRKTLNPMINETFEFKILREDFSSKRLQITMWSDNSLLHHPFLGEVLIDLENIPFNDTVKKWYELSPPSSGDIKLCLSHDINTNSVNVMVYKIRKLQTSSSFQTLDSYVKISVIPDENHKILRKRTQTQKKSNNPDFNESFSYPLKDITNIEEKMFVISVHCKTTTGGSSRIGSIAITLQEVIDKGNIMQWYPILRD